MAGIRLRPIGASSKPDSALGIKFLVDPEFGTADRVGGLTLTAVSGPPSRGAGTKGPARVYPGASDYYNTAGTLRATTAYSVLIYADIASVPSFGGLFAITSDSGTGQGMSVLQINATGPEVRLIENLGTVRTSTGGAAAKIYGAGPVACVVVWYGSRVVLWVNGQKLYDATGMTQQPGYTAGQGRVKLFSSRDVANTNGRLYLAAFAPDVAWSDEKARELSLSPLNIYQPAAIFPYAALAASAGSGSSYSYTADGGFVLSGAAANVRGRAKVASGGIATGGAAAVARRAQRAASGGLTLGGAAVAAKGRAIVTAGGLTLSGTASTLRGVARTAAGGITLAGAAGLTFFSAVQSRVVNPVGGLVLAGAAVVARSVRKTASGGIAFAGVALVKAGAAGGALASLLPWVRRRRR